MRIMTILGTRPEIIRLSLIIPRLDGVSNHTVVHTGQNYEPELDAVFFSRLKIRSPDVRLDSHSVTTFGQVGRILEGVEACIARTRPDGCLILGDTNSALSALVAERMGVPVFHMEAGNRCFDRRVPEERNRKLVDHLSTWLLPYVEGSRRNLLAEGIRGEAIFVTGNPIFEVLTHYRAEIEGSEVLERLGLTPGRFFLVTAHRAENVDVAERLAGIVTALNRLAERYSWPVVWSLHPRTRSKLHRDGLGLHQLVQIYKPFDLFDFVKLEKSALCVLTDSGTVQEECCLFRVPAVTMRDTTERPETIECGSNVLAGCDPDRILYSVELVTQNRFDWEIPCGYSDPTVSDKVVRIVLGNLGGWTPPL